MENSLIFFLLSLYYYTCSSQQVGLPLSGIHLTGSESCIQTSSVKANFSVGVTRTKILLYWLNDFHFQPSNYRKLQTWIFFHVGGKMTAEWRAEHAQWYGKLETCMIWALIDYIYILSIHCLHFYALCWDSTVHELMWRLRGFHLLLLSDKFHWNFCFPDPPKKLFKKKKQNFALLCQHVYGWILFSQASWTVP